MSSCSVGFWVSVLSCQHEHTSLTFPAGDDPPRDRTSELRKKGFEGRRLGPKQMTTDTAVRVTRMVTTEKSELVHSSHERSTNHAPVPLDKIPYVDYPELRVNKNESTEMPFRYVKGADGLAIMPEVSYLLGLWRDFVLTIIGNG